MTTIKLRRGTQSEWDAANPVLADGEQGLITDTGEVRAGDGATAFADLDPILSGTYAEARREAAKREISGVIEYEPSVEETATVAAASQGDTTLTDTSKSWMTDEHVGKWAEVKQNSSGESHFVARITGNTSDTLTLEYGLPYDTDADLGVDIRTPFERFYLADRTVLGDGASGSMDIRFVKEVIVERCATPDAGANGIAVRHADRVRIIDHEADNPGDFGVFVYNSDDVRVVRPSVSEWGNKFGVQLKDCRDGKIIAGTARDAKTGSEHGFNIKASGVHKTHDLSILGCAGDNVNATSSMSSIQQEGGTEYVAERFTVDGIKSKDCNRSFVTVYTAALTPEPTGEVRNVQQDGGIHGGSSLWPGLRHANLTVRGATEQAWLVGDGTLGADQVFDDCTFEDNNQDGVARAEVDVDGVTGTLIRTTTFGHHDSASASDAAVREANGASGTRVENANIDETVGSADGYGVDYDLSGSGSEAWATPGADSLADSAATTNVRKLGPAEEVHFSTGDLDPTGDGTPELVKVGGRWLAYAFDDATLERVAGGAWIPPSWNTYDVELWHSTNTGNAGAANLFVRYISPDSGAALGTQDVQFSQDVTAVATAGTLGVATLQAGVSTASGGTLIAVHRDGSAASDDLTGDFLIIAVVFRRKS